MTLVTFCGDKLTNIGHLSRTRTLDMLVHKNPLRRRHRPQALLVSGRDKRLVLFLDTGVKQDLDRRRSFKMY